MPVQSLGWQDPLEEDMVPHSRILAWEIPWTEEPAGLQSMQFQRVRHDRASNTSTLFFLSLESHIQFMSKSSWAFLYNAS